LTFATSWPAYQRVVSDLLVRGPDQIVSAFSGQASGGGAAFAKRLDVTLARIEEAAAAIDPGAPADAQDVAALGKPAARSAGLIRTSGFLLTLGTLGVLVIARILLTALLAVGPIFVLLALFPATRGLFEGWLRTTLMFALSPLVAILAGSLGLMMVDPLIASILQDPGSAAADMKAAGALILAAIIDFALMLAGMAAAAGLARGWRLPRGESAAAMKGGERLGNASPAVQTASETVQAQAMGDRLGAIISAVLREAPPATGSSSRAAPAPVRVDVVSAAGAGPARNDRRAGGLIRNQRGVQSSNSAQRQLR
jgi:type IV secretion system protein VirB6